MTESSEEYIRQAERSLLLAHEYGSGTADFYVARASVYAQLATAQALREKT
jgi:hypothetical protein